MSAATSGTGGTDLSVRDDLSKVWERWHIVWSPDFDARCIESARYGPTLAEAAAVRLTETAEAIERDAGKAALLLLDTALAGLTELAGNLLGRLKDLIRTDGSFFAVTAALGHLLYLYRYDAVLETAGRGEIARCSWLRRISAACGSWKVSGRWRGKTPCFWKDSSACARRSSAASKRWIWTVPNSFRC